MPSNGTSDQQGDHLPVRKPWQSWPTTWRYLVIRLFGQATPSAVLFWYVFPHR
jgi:hypothetical protein